MNLLFGSLFVAFSWAIASIIQKHLLQTLSPTFFLLTVFVFSIGFLLLFAPTPLDIPPISVRTYGLIALTALFGFVVSNWVLLHLIQHYAVSKVIALAYTTPIITLVLSRIFLQETIHPKNTLGIILVMVGIFFVLHKP